jgi:hypothetical protein
MFILLLVVFNFNADDFNTALYKDSFEYILGEIN